MRASHQVEGGGRGRGRRRYLPPHHTHSPSYSGLSLPSWRRVPRPSSGSHQVPLGSHHLVPLSKEMFCQPGERRGTEEVVIMQPEVHMGQFSLVPAASPGMTPSPLPLAACAYRCAAVALSLCGTLMLCDWKFGRRDARVLPV